MKTPGDNPGLALGALIAEGAVEPPIDANTEPLLWDGDYS